MIHTLHTYLLAQDQDKKVGIFLKSPKVILVSYLTFQIPIKEEILVSILRRLKYLFLSTKEDENKSMQFYWSVIKQHW